MTAQAHLAVARMDAPRFERTDPQPSADLGRTFTASRELLVLGQTANATAQAIEALSTQVIAQQIEPGQRSLAICGASAGVGATFLATNLAASISQTGISTLLVDANLRDPGVPRLITPSQEQIGVQQLLRGEATHRSEAICSEVLADLSILYSGGSAPDAAELLEGEAFRRLVDGCLRDYAFTIFDTPPANRWADTRAICKAAGYAMIVARRNVSVVDDVAVLANELAEDGVTVVGMIMNAG